MKTYEKILNDPDLQKIFNFYELSTYKTDKVGHGLKHMLRVVANAEKVSKLFRLNEQQTEAVMIAAVFHDIGVSVSGKADHAERSHDWAADFFKHKRIKHPLMNEILEAIRNHSHGSGGMICKFLFFADKIDICKTRPRPFGINTPGIRQYLHLTGVDFGIEDKCLVVKFTSDGKLNLVELNEHYFIPKTFTAIKGLADCYNMGYKILLDGNEWHWSARRILFNE